jgi:hypothetical protein
MKTCSKKWSSKFWPRMGVAGRLACTGAWLVLGLLLATRTIATPPTQSAPAKQAKTNKTATARAVVEAAYDQRRTQAMKAEMSMVLVDSGREWRRSALLFIKRINTVDDVQLFKFIAPADLAGSAVLTREQHKNDDDQWVYVPAYHTVRRIPAANRGDAYLGTDFFYEDVLDPRWNDYAFREVGRKKLDGFDCVAIESVPTSARLKASTAYSKSVFWVETKRSIIVQQEFYDKSGKLLKRLKNSSLKQYGKYLLWDQTAMENVQTHHKTLTKVTRRQVDISLPEDIFTPKSLKRG